MKYFIETYGCQMNFYDSRQMEMLLQGAGHEPAENLGEAEVLLLNTCAIRDSAEQRIWGQLGHHKSLKERGTLKILGLCGCMAQNHAEAIFKRAPHVDLVAGPDALAEISRMIDAIIGGDSGQLDVNFRRENPFCYEAQCSRNGREIKRQLIEYPLFVSVMKGCNYHCTYCVVPRVRGKEVCRAPSDIMHEVRDHVSRGAREVTLIGQTVNSYRYDDRDLSDILREVSSIDGLERVRFATSHPRGFSDRLIDAIAEESKVCEHVHLPVQSGSDRILKRMARRYTSGQYGELCDRIRKRVPNVSITTDIIVGFPGETDEDFEGTMELMHRVRWDGSFIFKYSPRQQTSAARHKDSVPDEMKTERFKRILNLQMEIAANINSGHIGSEVEILVEETAGNGRQCKGRTRGNKMAIVDEDRFDCGNYPQVGDLLQVQIEQASAYSLKGIPAAAPELA